jgi:hypothetical protein
MVGEVTEDLRQPGNRPGLPVTRVSRQRAGQVGRHGQLVDREGRGSARGMPWVATLIVGVLATIL